MDSSKNQVVLFSGGMDSTSLLFKVLMKAVEQPYVGIDLPVVTALSFNYGSRHNGAEISQAKRIVDWARNIFQPPVNLQHVILNIPPGIFKGKGSSLMGDAAVPEKVYEVDGPSNTEVPFRNSILISIAVAHALGSGGGEVFIAVHKSDGEGWAYPDCRPEFIEPMKLAVWHGSFERVKLHAPYLYITKGEIVTAGLEAGAPLEYTYSCYKGTEIHCGVCPTCLERSKAFVEADVADPTEYIIDPQLFKGDEDVQDN